LLAGLENNPLSTDYSQNGALIDNLYAQYSNGRTAVPNTGLHSGNVKYAGVGGVTFDSLFVDPNNGDFRPKPGGIVLSNLKSKKNDYDQTLTAFLATDAVGALSQNAPAPSYPF
jgi:hypothetical protein